MASAVLLRMGVVGFTFGVESVAGKVGCVGSGPFRALQRRTAQNGLVRRGIGVSRHELSSSG